MNPFMLPKRVLVRRKPQDMRCGIQRLSAIVETELGLSATDGTLYVFVSRDLKKVKLLAFEGAHVCMWYVRALKGTFGFRAGGEGVETTDAGRLLLMLRGVCSEGIPERMELSAKRIT